MPKILKGVVIGAAVGALVIASGGLAIGPVATATAYAGTAAASIGIGLTATMAGALAGGVIGGLYTAATSALAPSFADVNTQAGHKVPISNSIDTRKIVYGKARVGGAEIFIDEYDSNLGDDTPNDTVVLARAVSDREVEGFGKFYLQDKEVSFDASGNAIGEYNGFLFLKTYDGTQTTADPWLMAANVGWDASCVGNGIAYYVVKALYNQDTFPYGLTELRGSSIEVLGAKVYDPRKAQHNIADPATWEYSTNPALCIYDYLRDDILGNPVPVPEVDLDDIITAAVICDEQVSVKTGGTIDRYTLNGVVDGRETKEKNLGLMLSAMGGRQTYEGGKFRIFAAAPIIAASTIDDKFITGASYFPLAPSDQRFNEVRGTYLDPEEGYEPQEFPAQGDVAAQIDEGVVVQNINLPFTNDHRIAQRLARIVLQQARQPTMQISTLAVGAMYRPNDGLAVTWPNFELELEPFRITKQVISATEGRPLGVSLELIKEDPEIYDWDAAIDERPKIAGPLLNQYTGLEVVTPSDVQVTAVLLTAPDQSQKSTLQVIWNDPGPYVARTIVDYRIHDSGDPWTPGQSALRGDNNVTLDLLHSTAWDIRVRHVMSNGRTSPAVVILDALTDAVKSIYYTHFAWANSANGVTDFSTSSAVDRDYLGVLASLDPTPSQNPADYIWNFVRGPQGTQGIQGPQGPDGDPLYMWIAYAYNSDGSSGFTTGSPNENHKYFGVALNKTSSSESTNPNHYTWARLSANMTEQDIINQFGWTASGSEDSPVKYIPANGVSDGNYTRSGASFQNANGQTIASVSLPTATKSNEQVIVIAYPEIVTGDGRANYDIYLNGQTVGFVTGQSHGTGSGERQFMTATVSKRFVGAGHQSFSVAVNANYVESGASAQVKRAAIAIIRMKR